MGMLEMTNNPDGNTRSPVVVKVVLLCLNIYVKCLNIYGADLLSLDAFINVPNEALTPPDTPPDMFGSHTPKSNFGHTSSSDDDIMSDTLSHTSSNHGMNPYNPKNSSPRYDTLNLLAPLKTIPETTGSVIFFKRMSKNMVLAFTLTFCRLHKD